MRRVVLGAFREWEGIPPSDLRDKNELKNRHTILNDAQVNEQFLECAPKLRHAAHSKALKVVPIEFQ